ncbi:unnamed protein product [Nesidiocoris tenuis]|uniref:Integrase catalytic domain-containing protein n=1 Tax=Nesidiocoris tenuis TaxID=355587 RepID=A0A6H5GAL0_9HEMI|nr:unnamed protein product [Nesidiocoris tenuis]
MPFGAHAEPFTLLRRSGRRRRSRRRSLPRVLLRGRGHDRRWPTYLTGLFLESQVPAFPIARNKWQDILFQLLTIRDGLCRVSLQYLIDTFKALVAFSVNSRIGFENSRFDLEKPRIDLGNFQIGLNYSQLGKFSIGLRKFTNYVNSQIRPGKQNSAADALSRVKTHTVSAVHSDSDLMMLHIALCHPGVTRFAHWVRVKNLPYSIEDVRRVTSSCDTCKELKPQFFKSDPGVLVKATTPFERLNIDFKGPLPRSSSTGCSYMLTVVDEYSRFPFAFPCRDLSSKTVIKHLTSLFSVFGSPAFIHSDRGTAFMSQEFKDFLLSRKIATSRTTAYNPQGNGQVEKYNGTIWNAVRLALHSKGLPLTDWELMLDDALHSIRSLLCTATNNTPHERMFSHVRRSSSGCSLPSWLCQPGNKVYMKRHVRNSKYDPAVDEVDLIEVNPEYAFVKLPDGRETTVSLKHLAPSGVRASGESSRASHDCNGDQETRIDSTEDPPLEAQGQQSADHQGAAPPLELPELRRSQRIRQKPQFFGDPVSH